MAWRRPGAGRADEMQRRTRRLRHGMRKAGRRRDRVARLHDIVQPAPGGITDSGRVKTRWVCPDCGICLCGGVKIGTEAPGYTRIVRGGTLDDTSWLKPTTHFYTRNKQPWVILPEGATIYETTPDRV